MKTKIFSLYGNATAADGKNHVVTIVGKLETGRKPKEFKENAFINGELKFTRKVFTRKLTLGMSICHPLDTFDEQVGIDVAKARIERGDTLGSLQTNSVTMLTDDAVLAEVLVKLQYVIDNIDDFLPVE